MGPMFVDFLGPSFVGASSYKKKTVGAVLPSRPSFLKKPKSVEVIK
jgi:hypothetical protein